MGGRALTAACIILDMSELCPRHGHCLLRSVGLWLWLRLSSACLAKPVFGNLSPIDTAVEDRESLSDDRDHQNWEEEVQSLSFPQTFGWWGREDGTLDLSGERKIGSCWNSKLPDKKEHFSLYRESQSTIYRQFTCLFLSPAFFHCSFPVCNQDNASLGWEAPLRKASSEYQADRRVRGYGG